MMDYNFLPFFIRENIYLVDEPDDQKPEAISSDSPTTQGDTAANSKRQQNPGVDMNKSLIVVTHSKDGKGINENEKELLEKILHAIHYTFNDINFFNDAEINDFKGSQFASGTKLLTFGVPPEAIIPGKHHPYYQVIRDEKDKGYLFADTLEALINDRNKKKKLWEKLKELFL